MARPGAPLQQVLHTNTGYVAPAFQFPYDGAFFAAHRISGKKQRTPLLNTGPHAGKVGAFEGALYESKGYYRPQADCIMFTRDEVGFCAVCRRAIERVIALYAR